MRSRALLIVLALSLGFSLAVAMLVASPSLQQQEKLFLQANLSPSAGGLAQLFFDIGRGFNEKDSVLVEVHRKETKLCRFPLPLGKIYNLRFDPINSQADVTITAPLIVDARGTILYRFRASDFTAGQHIKTMEKLDDGVAIVCTEGGVDPFLSIAVPPNLSAPFVLKAWLRVVAPATCIMLLIIGSSCLAGISINEARLGRLSAGLRTRPFLTLSLLSAIAVLFQFHPLYFGSRPPAESHGTIFNLSTYNSGKVNLELASRSPLTPGNIFFSVPTLLGNTRWLKATGIIGAWWGYVFGVALLSWFTTRSLTTAVIIGGCALFTSAWKTGVLPLSTPALVMAPWILLAWGWLATRPRSHKAFFFCGAAILLGNLEMVAIESSLRTAMLAVATTLAGLLYIGFQSQPRLLRLFRAGVGLFFFGLFCAIVALTLWRMVLTPGDGSAEAAKNVLQAIPATIGLSLFEGFFLLQNPGSFPLPSLNLVVLAGLAWAFARSEENYSRPSFMALALTVLPIAILAAGMLPDPVFVAWIRRSNAAQFQHAGWYTLVALLPLLASFGFAGLRQRLETPDRAFYLAKAALFFFIPFVMYFGTVQSHAGYTFTSAYLICVIVGWIVAHLALTRLRLSLESRASTVLVTFTVLMVWWHHAAYIHLVLKDAIAAP